MLDVFGFPTPQGANYQEFYGGGTVRDWVKPRGASMVRMLLIGPGGGGNNGTTSVGGGGGGSGAITSWIGPAIFIPDVLRISIGAGGAVGSSLIATATTIVYQAKNGTGYTLLTANGGQGTSDDTGGPGAIVTANNFFGAAGIYTNIAGQAGRGASSSINRATALSFLTGGAGGATSPSGGSSGSVPGNYGYPTISGGAQVVGGAGGDGFFITQPILYASGGAGGGGSTTATGGTGGRGGIGCGGGGGGRCTTGSALGGRGGDGAVFIWSW